jgi:hypothetical protein
MTAPDRETPETFAARCEFEKARWMTGKIVPDGWETAAKLERSRDALASLLLTCKTVFEDDAKHAGPRMADFYGDLIRRIQAALGRGE